MARPANQHLRSGSVAPVARRPGGIICVSNGVFSLLQMGHDSAGAVAAGATRGRSQVRHRQHEPQRRHLCRVRRAARAAGR